MDLKSLTFVRNCTARRLKTPQESFRIESDPCFIL